MKVKLAQYDPDWKLIFQKEKQLVLEVLKHFDPVIEHIGSTSVEGLSAKPVIDIMIGVKEKEDLDRLVPDMKDSGYLYIKKYEDQIPERRFFQKVINNVIQFNIHVVELNSFWWKRHLAFRDHLRNNVETRIEYEQLKNQLSQKDWDSTNDYAAAKTNFIRRVENEIL